MKSELPRSDGKDRQLIEASKDDFKQASSAVWDQQVRTALIFNKELFTCKACMAFFSRDNGPNDHPADQTFLVTKLCVTGNITSEDSFFLALWAESLRLLPVYGRIIMPRFSTQHLQPPAVKSEVAVEGTVPWLQARLLILEQTISHLTRQIKEINADNHQLKAENDELLGQVLHIKNNQEAIQWKARTHLQKLEGLLTPDFASDP